MNRDATVRERVQLRERIPTDTGARIPMPVPMNIGVHRDDSHEPLPPTLSCIRRKVGAIISLTGRRACDIREESWASVSS